MVFVFSSCRILWISISTSSHKVRFIMFIIALPQQRIKPVETFTKGAQFPRNCAEFFSLVLRSFWWFTPFAKPDTSSKSGGSSSGIHPWWSLPDHAECGWNNWAKDNAACCAPEFSDPRWNHPQYIPYFFQKEGVYSPWLSCSCKQKGIRKLSPDAFAWCMQFCLVCI